ncbi:MAG: DNA primase [Lachnospiraceae bacterium]|nr:DNA primase [Lachnospiraceae bacterium]
MYYPEEIVEEVRQKSDIVDVISGYVRLQKKGSTYFGLCPFHNEKTPSFSVSPNKQMYYCFGCGAGGNVFSFVMNYENFTFREAVKHLADRAGVALPEINDSKEYKEKETHRQKLLAVNKEAAKFFYYQLRSPQGQVGLNYLKKRELTDETMQKFGLGYSLKTSDSLVKYLRSKGYDDSLIKEVGLANFNEKMGLHDIFWNRVMFPIQDINHRVIGFGGRVMGDGNPKYLNSPETPIFDKRRNLFGLNFARTARTGNFILCEGYMDVISMHQAGFTQAVASLGTAFTAEQAVLLKRYTDSVLLAYDSDGAGTKAALRAIGMLREAGLSGKVINMKPCKDPDEFIKTYGADAFKERMDNAENSFFFEIRILEGQYNLNDPEDKTRFHRSIAEKLCEFEEEVERENYIQAVADKYHIGFDNLRKLVVSYASKTGLAKPVERPKSSVQAKEKEAAGARQQRLLITWLSEEPELFPTVKKYVTPEDFTDPIYKVIAEKAYESFEKTGGFNPASIVSFFEDEEEQRRVAAAFNTGLAQNPETLQDRQKAFNEIIVGIKEESNLKASADMGSDMTALQRFMDGKKALEELKRHPIVLQQ